MAVLAFENGALSPAAEDIDGQTGGAIRKAVAASRFKGKPGQTLDLLAPAGVDAGRVLVVGGGENAGFSGQKAETFAAHAYQALKMSGAASVAVMLPGATPDQAAQAALGARLASYRFDRYRTKDGEDKKPSIHKFHIACDDPKAAKKAYACTPPWPKGWSSPATSSPNPPTFFTPKSSRAGSRRWRSSASR